MTDHEILEFMIKKDEFGLQAFIEKYHDLLYILIRNILSSEGSHEDIEECIYDTFLYVWNRIDKFNPNKYSLKNWLCLIARGRAHNRLNKLIKNQSVLRRLMDQRSAKLLTALDVIVSKENYKSLLILLDQFNEPQREVLFRRYVYGEKPIQISLVMELDIKKENYLLYEGKKQILKVYQEVNCS